MIQKGLLPQVIRRIDYTQTADALGYGLSLSGQRYLVKATVPWHPQLPASEWICHHLARCLQLAVPDWDHCVLPDGRDAIGSRVEGSVMEREFYPVERPNTDNPEVVSRTYVLDLFVSNADRHQGQWLVTEAGGGTLLRPIDFSRAWYRHWPLPLPLPPFGKGARLPKEERDNSGSFYDIAKRHGVLSSDEATCAWETLHQLKKDTWRSIVHSVPEGWISVGQANELTSWWWSPMWRTRMNWIRTQL